MALVGTLSGSNGTSNTAITGTLVVANTTVGFPSIPSDATVFISGSIGGKQSGTGVTVFGGDIVVSGSITTNGFITGSIYSYAKKTTSYNMVSSDAIIGVSGSAASTIRLPDHATCVNGQYFIIKDEAGNAGTFNITISGSASPGTDTIDGQLGTLLSNNFAAVTIYKGSDSGKFFIV